MKHSALVLLALLFLVSCTDRKKIVHEQTFYYAANTFYTGNYPLYYSMAAWVHATKVNNHLKLEAGLSGIHSATDLFSIHIHQKDPTQPFGYSGNPVLDLGHIKKDHAVISKEFPNVDFDYFTREFDGFFVVHDPNNVQNDTTTLLMYGKIGAVN